MATQSVRYEPPALVVLGTLLELTLGRVGGPTCDVQRAGLNTGSKLGRGSC